MTRIYRPTYPAFLQIYSQHDQMESNDWYEVAPASAAEYAANVKCGRLHCAHPKQSWSIDPKPFHMTVTRETPASTNSPLGGGGFIELVRERLRDLIAPHLHGAVWGVCTNPDGTDLKHGRMCTLQMPRELHVNAMRNRGNHHYQCAVCMQVVSFGRAGIVQSQVRDRQIVCDASHNIFIDPDLADRLKLNHLLPDIRFLPTPLLAKPRDGWTLPGDPGWDGRLRTPWQWIEYLRSTAGAGARLNLRV